MPEETATEMANAVEAIELDAERDELWQNQRVTPFGTGNSLFRSRRCIVAVGRRAIQATDHRVGSTSSPGVLISGFSFLRRS